MAAAPLNKFKLEYLSFLVISLCVFCFVGITGDSSLYGFAVLGVAIYMEFFFIRKLLQEKF